MDYQTFNSHSLGGPFPTAQQPTQQHVYGDPQARIQQSAPSTFYGANPSGQAGGFPMASGMGGGSMTSTNGGLSQQQLHHARAASLQQQQHQHQHQQQHQQQASPSPYSSAPYSQGLSSPAVTAGQKYAQFHKPASPSTSSNHVSPYTTPQAQQQSPHMNSQPPPGAMAAPSNPQSAPSTQTQTPVKAVPQSPVSPSAQAREKERMTTLLEINNVLLQEVVNLQVQGKAGHVGPPPPTADGKPEGDKQQPSKEYVDCMRRLQSNLSYLAQNAEKNHKPNQALQPGPAIMALPQSPPELIKLYTKLQSLYPGWKGVGPAMKASPGLKPGQPNNGAMQPPHSAGLVNNMQQAHTNGQQQAAPQQSP